ncbi:MAG: zinc metallopeptidase [Butyrivibrio sp.]|uniref:zinc metallopeptidase n=1 Tax=Butyrivibrio sp. TaxID=28121 RepID=UPI0025E4CCD9|nr:zinc metallopeptidase [Butyrivibrio sp.]MCR5771838.1 zinc metallopeptidase [Butyrivibrio sp.]
MGYYNYYYFDWTYILVIIGAVLSIVASLNVKASYSKYAKVANMRGITGAEAARRILEANNVMGVSVQHVSGELTDHYDPRTQTVNLSDSVYNSTSVAALGVAAHECGHVMQHETGYTPLKIRTALVPAANIGSRFGIYIVFFGIILALEPLTTIGIWVFSLAVLFQIVTLPVEFDASRRALVMLEGYGMMGHEEVTGARKVLTAAALTYVAAAASSVMQLARLIILRNSRRNND